MLNKHYEKQGFSHFGDRVTNSVTVRLSDREIEILEREYSRSPVQQNTLFTHFEKEDFA